VRDAGADVQFRAVLEKVTSQQRNDGLHLSDLRDNVLEKLFDLSPERLKEVYESIDRDSDGRILKEGLMDGLHRCELHGLEHALDTVLQTVSTSQDGSLQLAEFESILTRLKLAQLLCGETYQDISAQLGTGCLSVFAGVALGISSLDTGTSYFPCVGSICGSLISLCSWHSR
jgi:uncharacterized protein YerC